MSGEKRSDLAKGIVPFWRKSVVDDKEVLRKLWDSVKVIEVETPEQAIEIFGQAFQPSVPPYWMIGLPTPPLYVRRVADKDNERDNADG